MTTKESTEVASWVRRAGGNLEKERDADLHKTVTPEPVAEFCLLWMYEDMALSCPFPGGAQAARDGCPESL